MPLIGDIWDNRERIAFAANAFASGLRTAGAVVNSNLVAEQGRRTKRRYDAMQNPRRRSATPSRARRMARLPQNARIRVAKRGGRRRPPGGGYRKKRKRLYSGKRKSFGRKRFKKSYRAVNKFVTRGYILKREIGGIVQDAECAYLGHNAVTMGDLWSAITFSVVRWFARKMGQDICNWNEFVSGFSTGDPNVAWKLSYKLDANAPILVSTVPTAGPTTWQIWADSLFARLQLLIATNDYFELIRIEHYSPDNLVGVRDVPFTCIEAKSMMVTVVGNSNMMLQNITLANNVVGDNEAEVVTNLTNNPLRGKEYTGFGQSFPLQFQNHTGVGNANLSAETEVFGGLVKFAYSDAFAMSPEMVVGLQKPPPYYKWHGFTGNKYITLKPAEIRRSKIVKSYTMDLAKWIQMCLPYLKAAPEGNRNNIKFIGKVTFFGLEKMLDCRTLEPDIRIAYEITHTTSAVAFYKPSLKIDPRVILDPIPKSYGP